MGGDAYRPADRSEAMISLGAKSVRQARWMLSALDYGKVMDVSRLGKNSEGIQIRAIRK